MQDWNEKATRLLRTEMMLSGVRYAELAERLEGMGEPETVANLRNKLSRGSFTAAFFIKCLAALNVKMLRLDE